MLGTCMWLYAAWMGQNHLGLCLEMCSKASVLLSLYLFKYNNNCYMLLRNVIKEKIKTSIQKQNCGVIEFGNSLLK
jgi:hypothetical protein